MRIFNEAAAFGLRMMNYHNTQMNLHLKRLSSGYRINSAADDAAGLAISERMRSQINGLRQAQRNIMDGISAYQTEEGALQEIQDILHRINVLAVQASNGTLNDDDRSHIQVEVDELINEVNRMITTVEFNTKKLLTNNGMGKLHIGANANQTVEFYSPDLSNDSLSLNGINVSTQNSAESAIGKLAVSINKVSKIRAVIGAKINRLEHSYNLAGIMAEKQTAAESRIRDADFAEEMMQYVKHQILFQTSQSVFMQSLNFKRNSILKLFENLNKKHKNFL